MCQLQYLELPQVGKSEMKHIIAFRPFLTIYLFSIVVFRQSPLFHSFSDNHFGHCLSKYCGNLSIDYPFYMSGKQESYCGYPGFEILCKDDNLPYINVSGVSYVVKNVSYEDQTLRVINSLLYNSFNDKSGCSGALHQLNVTLNNDVFECTPKHTDVFLLFDCPHKIMQENSPNMVFCDAVGVYQNDSKLKTLEKECHGNVSVPYEADRMNVGNVKEMLEEGFSLNWTANNCSDCKQSGGQCGYSQGISEFTCFCPDRTHSHHCDPIKKKSRRLLLGVLALGASAMAIMILIGPVICIKRRITLTSKIVVPWSTRNKGNQNVEAFLKIYGSFAPMRYTVSDIKLMTTSFKHKLGEGGYGTVYKGKLTDGRPVAVKKLKNVKGNGEEFINEVASISRTNHINVVSLLGFCSQGNSRALVYEFMPNGSLEKYVCREGNALALTQEILLNIAVGVAKGLDYLHKGCNARILHLDIKPHNILLDEEFCPKISDFGLAKLSETKNSMTSMLEARGTIGYIAPEVFCRTFGAVSHKSDVYSYGMMVLDMACGRKNVLALTQNSSEQYFPDWIYNQLQLEDEVDVNAIADHDRRGLLRQMILVGLWCIQTYPSNRPSMNRVVEMLEGDVKSIEMPPKPLLSSPPRSGTVGSGTLVPVP